MAKRKDHEGHYFEQQRQTAAGKMVTLYCWRIKVGGRDAKPIVRKRQTKDLLRAEVKKIVRKLEDQGFLERPSADPTVKQRLTQWLEVKIKPNSENSTWRSYEEHCRLYIIPAIGKVPLSKLGPLHVQQIIAYMKKTGKRDGEPFSPRSIEYAVSVFFRGLPRQQAILLRGKVKDDDVVIPSGSRARDRVLSSEEIDKIVGRAYKTVDLKTKPGQSKSLCRDRHLVKFLLNAGTRINEALAISIFSLNLKAGEESVHICRQVEWVKEGDDEPRHGAIKEYTKTKKNRIVPLNDAALKAVRDQLAMIAAEKEVAGQGYDDRGLLFPTQSGSLMHSRNVLRTVARLAKLEGIPPVTTHDLRRTFGTHFADIEPRIHLVGSVMGHEKPETTLKHYVWAQEKIKKTAISKLKLGRPMKSSPRKKA